LTLVSYWFKLQLVRTTRQQYQLKSTSNGKYHHLWLIGLTLLTLLLSQQCHEHHSILKVGLIGDQTGTYHPDDAVVLLDSAVKKIIAWNPDLIIHVGDMVESIKNVKSMEEYRTQFEKVAKIVKSSGLPWLIAAGDHDVNPPVYQPLSTDHSRETWLVQLSRKLDMPFQSRLYYSFDYRGFHFIALYSLENLHTDPRWGSIFLNSISDEQLAWLANDLESHKKSRGIIVVVHHPHWYSWSNWYRVHELLRRYPVIAVVAGHFHYDQDDGIIDGIRYLVMGSTGGAIKDCDIHSGGIQEYGLMTVDDQNMVKLQLKAIENDSVLELTPRRSMDRLQALECMLDNLWSDNDLKRQGKLIYSDGSSTANRDKIFLKSIGNPIDLPVQINIDYDPEILFNPIWYFAGKTIQGDTAITLYPGERILWANYSNVGQVSKINPIWGAEINPDIITSINSIHLSVTVTFNDNRTRWIKKELYYQINRGRSYGYGN